MGAGAKVFDAAGNIVFDLTKRNGNIDSMVETGSGDGYVDIMGNDGEPFWSLVTSGLSAARQPEISAAFLGDRWRISWTWPYPSSVWVSCLLTYGVY